MAEKGETPDFQGMAFKNLQRARKLREAGEYAPDPTADFLVEQAHVLAMLALADAISGKRAEAGAE